MVITRMHFEAGVDDVKNLRLDTHGIASESYVATVYECFLLCTRWFYVNVLSFFVFTFARSVCLRSRLRRVFRFAEDMKLSMNIVGLQ